MLSRLRAATFSRRRLIVANSYGPRGSSREDFAVADAPVVYPPVTDRFCAVCPGGGNSIRVPGRIARKSGSEAMIEILARVAGSEAIGLQLHVSGQDRRLALRGG